MSAVWIAADMNFFSEEEAEKNYISVDEYNLKMVSNWNEVIEPDDFVLLLGTITKNDDINVMQKIFSNLSGRKKYIIRTKDKELIKKWTEIGCEFVGNISSFMVGEIQGHKEKIITYCDKVYYDKAKGKCFIADPTSIIGTEEPYKNKTLNIAVNQWGYFPLRTDEIPNLFNSMMRYETMQSFN